MTWRSGFVPRRPRDGLGRCRLLIPKSFDRGPARDGIGEPLPRQPRGVNGGRVETGSTHRMSIPLPPVTRRGAPQPVNTSAVPPRSSSTVGYDSGVRPCGSRSDGPRFAQHYGVTQDSFLRTSRRGSERRAQPRSPHHGGLLCPQRDHRVHPRCASRREIARQQGNRREEAERRDDDRRIGRADPVELALEHPAEEQRCTGS